MLFSKSTGNHGHKIIFIHGNSSSSNYWLSCLEGDLKNSYTCIAIDLPGHGASEASTKPEKDYTMQGMANRVLEYLTENIDGSYILVGHSLGCNIIGEMASQLTNCKGIFLTAPSVIGKNLTPGDIMLQNEALTALFTDNPSEEQIQALIENVGSVMGEKNQQTLYNDYKNVASGVRSSLFQSIIQAQYCDEISAIEALNVPFAVAFGRNETACNIKYFDQLGLQLYKDQAMIVENAGHYLNYDQTELMNSLISEFAQFCFKATN